VKKYQRAAGNELDTFLIRNNKIKDQPELFNVICDIDGNVINPESLKRANEMTGAGIEYATSLIEYICTHHNDFIKKTNSAMYYETEQIEWAFALDIMTGGITVQRSRAAKELLRLHAHPKPILIKRKDGRMVSMQPFVIAFDWGRPETLDARAAANLARMQKGAEKLARRNEVIAAKKENRQVNTEGIEYPDLLPIEKLSIQFSIPLFEDLMNESGNTYSFPTGMYAKMFHFARFHQKTYQDLKRKGYQRISAHLNHFENMNDPQISAIARFARYIVRHNNLTAKQVKNKDHVSTINIPLFPMISEVYPSAISANGRGERYLDMKKVVAFLDMSLFIYLCIDNFIFYPVIERGGFTLQKLTIKIYTDVKKAEQSQGLNSENGEAVRKILSLSEKGERLLEFQNTPDTDGSAIL
jgi:hypothetical protein